MFFDFCSQSWLVLEASRITNEFFLSQDSDALPWWGSPSLASSPRRMAWTVTGFQVDQHFMTQCSHMLQKWHILKHGTLTTIKTSWIMMGLRTSQNNQEHSSCEIPVVHIQVHHPGSDFWDLRSALGDQVFDGLLLPSKLFLDVSLGALRAAARSGGRGFCCLEI